MIWVTILTGVWVGEVALVAGENAVVATGAVLKRDVEPYTAVAGVPARKIKTFTAGKQRRFQT